MSKLKFLCKNCQKELIIASEAIGQRANCAACGIAQTVPTTEADAAFRLQVAERERAEAEESRRKAEAERIRRKEEKRQRHEEKRRQDEERARKWEEHIKRQDEENRRRAACRRCGRPVSFLDRVLWEDGQCNDCRGQEGEQRRQPQTQERTEATRARANSTKQALGLAGSLLLFFGVFAPLLSVPTLGHVNYIHDGTGDGIIILVLALISVALVLTGKYQGLWLTGLGSVGLMAFTFINFQMKMSGAREKMNSDLADNPFRGLAEAALESVQLEWGWAVLILGAGLVIGAAALQSAGKTNSSAS